MLQQLNLAIKSHLYFSRFGLIASGLHVIKRDIIYIINPPVDALPKISMPNATIVIQRPRTALGLLLWHEANSQMVLDWDRTSKMAVFMAHVPYFL